MKKSFAIILCSVLAHLTSWGQPEGDTLTFGVEATQNFRTYTQDPNLDGLENEFVVIRANAGRLFILKHVFHSESKGDSTYLEVSNNGIILVDLRPHGTLDTTSIISIEILSNPEFNWSGNPLEYRGKTLFIDDSNFYCEIQEVTISPAYCPPSLFGNSKTKTVVAVLEVKPSKNSEA